MIVGLGYAGMVNAVTRHRTGRLPPRTLLLGRPDPWRGYVDHPMGQFPAMLSLPGYSPVSQPRTAPYDFLSSKRFAAANLLEKFALLRSTSAVQALAWVDEPISRVGRQWVATLRRAQSRVAVRAKQLDLCTGPGRGRVFNPGEDRISGPWAWDIRERFDPTLFQDLADGSGASAVVAEDFM